MPHALRSHLSRKLLLAIGLPSFALALAGVLWLASATHQAVPGVWSRAAASVLALAVAMTGAHVLAVRVLLEQPLSRIVASLRRAEHGDFLMRVPVESEDELGQLARSFNTALAAITDLHVRRIEDARSLESMQRELALKEEIEVQHRLADEARLRLEQRVRELDLLAELSRTFNSTLRLDELLQYVTEHVARALGQPDLALLLADERTGGLEVKSVFGLDPGLRSVALGPGQGLAGAAARSGEVVLVTDVAADERTTVQPWLRERGGSAVAVPMISRGACVGVLDLFRPARDAFGQDELRLLRAVADQAAMAIANARLHERTVRLSLTDPLTGLHNRRSLFARLEMELERSSRFAHACALVMLDVDHFKALNDRAGHLAGDAVLRRMGQVLGGAVRRVDTLARYGGEEFALLLPRADTAAGLEVAHKLRAIVADTPFEHGPEQPGGRVTISAGVAAFPGDARELGLLIDCADAALYAAKRRGRDAVVAYEPGMREDPGRRRDVRTTAALEPS